MSLIFHWVVRSILRVKVEQKSTVDLTPFLFDPFFTDLTPFYSLIAIEAALSLCYHISSKQLKKVPENYAECFQLVCKAGLIPDNLADNLQKMARFRNFLVHVYWEIDEEALCTIITCHLDDMRRYCEAVVRLL